MLPLTPCAAEVLRLMVDRQMSRAEIGRLRRMAYKTIARHVWSIRKKRGLIGRPWVTIAEDELRRRIGAMKLTLLLLALPLYGQITIDAGSPADQHFFGGAPWAIVPPGSTDATLRFGVGFRYKIPAEGPQLLTLRFREPNMTQPGQRVFSVSANHQPVIQGLDLVAEGGSLSRSFVVAASDGFVDIRFTTLVRSAVVSSITLEPLSLARSSVTFAGQTVELQGLVNGEVQMLVYPEIARQRYNAPAVIVLYSGFPLAAMRTKCPDGCPVHEGHSSEASKTWRVTNGVFSER